MARSDLGNKCVCQSCGTKFYDLKKSPVQCPSCDEPYDVKRAKSAETKMATAGSRWAPGKPASPTPPKPD